MARCTSGDPVCLKIAYLFPGQGAQTPGFLRRLPGHSLVRETLREATQILRHEVYELDSSNALTSTVAVQLSTLIAGVAVARALIQEGVRPDAVAGLSVGCFAAAVIAEALTFPDALKLVKLRGEAMEKEFRTGFGMAAILGLNESRVSTLIKVVGDTHPMLYIANINAPTQIVVAGTVAALDALIALSLRTGARQAERMRIAVPSHCPLLEHVSQQLATAFQSIDLKAPLLPYVSNCTARATCSAAEVREDLIGNVSRTIRWHDTTTVLYELGVRLFIEPPPGRVLTSLVQNGYPDARAVAVEFSGLDDAVILGRRGRKCAE